jgi:hypothetical protein
MRWLRLALVMVTVSVVALVESSASAVQWQVLYETDFSTDPNWTTNDPAKLGWDAATETYHGIQTNNQPSYASTDVTAFDPNKTWRLEFDSVINSCAWSAGMDMGLFGSGIGSPGALNAVLDQSNVDSGHVTALYTNGAANYTYSPSWESGTWYHSLMEFDSDAEAITLTITVRDTGDPKWSFTHAAASFPTDLTKIGVSRENMYWDGVNTVDYNLDNVVLSRAVPEPSAFALFSVGATSLLAYAWRRRRAL